MSEAGSEAEGGGRRERRRDRYLRRARKVALVLLLTFLGLFVLGVAGARIYLNEERSRQLGMEIFASVLQGRLEIEAFHWERFPERIRLESVRLFAPHGESVVEAGELEAEIALRPLLWQRVQLREVILRDARVNLLPAQPAQAGQPEPPAFALIEAVLPDGYGEEEEGEVGSSSGWRVTLEDLRLEGLDVELELESLSVSARGLQLPEGSLDLLLPGVESRLGKLEAESVTLRTLDRELALGPVVVAEALYHRDAIGPDASFQIEGLRASGEGLELTGDLRLSELDLEADWGLRASVQAQVELGAPVLELDSLGLTTSGRLELQLDAGGTLGDPRLDLLATAPSVVVVEGQRLQAVRLEAALEEGSLSLRKLRAGIAGGTVAIDGRVQLLPEPGAFEAKAKLTRLPGRLAAAFGAPAEWLPDEVGGTVMLEGKLLTALAAGYRLDLEVLGLPSALPAGLPGRVKVVGRGRVSEASIGITELKLVGGDLELAAGGKVLLGETPELELSVQGLVSEVAGLAAALELPPMRGGLELEAAVTGPLTSPSARGDLILGGLRTPWVPPISGSLPFAWDGRALAVEEGRLSLARGQLRLHGTLGLLDPAGSLLEDPQVEVEAEARGLSLEVLELPEIEGLLQLEGRVQGSLRAPTGRISAQVTEGKAGGLALATAEALVIGEGGGLRIQRLLLEPEGGGELTGQGSVDLAAETLAIVFDLKQVPLPLFAPFLPEVELAGTVGANLEVAGPWTDPTVQGPLGFVDLSVAGIDLGTLGVEVTGQRSAVRVDATLEGPAGRLTAQGTVVDDGAGLRSTRIETRGLRLAALLPVTTAVARGGAEGTDATPRVVTPRPGRSAREEEGPDARGGDEEVTGPMAGPEAPIVDAFLTADLQLAGAFPLPEIRGQVRATELRLAGERLPGGDAVARITPREDGVEIALSALGVLDGQIGARWVEGQPTVSGSGTLRRLALSTLLPSLGEYETEVVTAGDLHFDLVGDAWELSAELSTLSLALSFGNLTQQAPVKLHYGADGLRVEPFVLSGPGGRFEAGGRWGERLDLRAKGEVDLGLLPPFVEAISRARGRVRVDLKVQGTPELPDLQGEITLNGPATLRPRTTVGEVTLLDGGIELRGSEAILQGIVGEIGSGSFSVSGMVTLAGEKAGAHRLAVRAEGLPLRLPDLVLEVNGMLGVEGQLPETLVRGEVEVVRGRYLQKFELKRFNFKAQEVDLDEPLEVTYPWLLGIGLDLTAVSAGGLEVVANAGPFSLELRLDSDLRIKGTAAEPLIEGKISSTQGTIVFPAATLQVGEARIDFEPTGGEGIAPVLSLMAEGEVSPPMVGGDALPTYFVTMGLAGDPFDEMPLTLTSDPSLSQLEVLSLLTTGRASPDLEAGGGAKGAGDAALAFAGSQLAEPLTRFVTQQLERNLNLELQLDAGITSEGVTVTAGKEITRRLRLEGSFERSFETKSVATGRARFLLSDRLFLEYTGESVSGAADGAEDGTSNRLELKLRLLGR